MSRIYTKNEITETLNSKGYKILSPYTRIADTHKIIDTEGYLYETNLKGLISGNATPKKFSNKNPHTIENIKTYISNNNLSSNLLSTEYVRNTSKLDFQCGCDEHTIFKRSWRDFQLGRNICSKCAIRKSGKYNYAKEWEYANTFFKEHNCELVTKEMKYICDKIEFICNNHKEKGVQSISWASAKSKNIACKFCGRKKAGDSKRIPEEEIKKIVEDKGFIFDHVDYSKKKCTIYYFCKQHYDKGLQQRSLESMRKSNGKCSWCSYQKIDLEELNERIRQKHKNIKVLGELVTLTKPAKCFCETHSSEFWIEPNRLLHSGNCPKCSKENRDKARKKKKKNQNDFEKEVKEKFNGDISLISEYKGAKLDVTCKCNIHNYIFITNASSLVNNKKFACPLCVGEDVRLRCIKSEEQFLKELQSVNPNITPLEPYINDHTKIKCKCDAHNYIWQAAPNKILHRNTGCPKCCSSSGENIISGILDKWDIPYNMQKRFKDCVDKKPLPFDFFLYEHNIIIEYDGEGHYKPIKRSKKTDAKKQLVKVQQHDKIKDDYCFKNKIKLIRVPYWDKDDIEYILFDKLTKYSVIKEIK